MKSRKENLLFARFRAAEAGVAAVEFALILPIMLFAYLGTMEASALISMDRRIQSVAGVVGDLVARTDNDTALTMANLKEYVKAATSIMTPYTTATLTQTVTQVEVAADGTTKVIDSLEFTNGEVTNSSRHIKGRTYKLPDAMLNISRGAYVIALEASYSYTPFYSIVFDEPVNLYRESFYLPRFDSSKEIQLPDLP